MTEPLALYNEIDPYAADWLENLIAAGHIAPGVVDRRSIVDLRPADLAGYRQVHFFAGIGVWSLALRRAGWPDHRPIWTGSCPCQPFSSAGKGGGFDDERHLWPYFHHLIRVCRPDVVVGEQVASKDGLAWIDLVQADLEGEGYAAGAVDTCAAGFGAPHIRQRLYWAGVAGMADSAGAGWRSKRQDGNPTNCGKALCGGASQFGRCGSTGKPCRLADGAGDGRREERAHAGRHPFGDQAEGRASGSVPSGADLWMVDPFGPGLEGQSGHGNDRGEPGRVGADQTGSAPATGGAGFVGYVGRPGPTGGLWSAPEWLFCRDGKWRAVEPGSFPLAHGAPSRVGRLRAYGNAITLGQAQGFVEALMECLP